FRYLESLQALERIVPSFAPAATPGAVARATLDGMSLPPIRSAAVLGAGVMGAQIAAHLANAGVHVLLLDISAHAAHDGLARARTLKPPPFFTADRAALITTGSLDTDLGRVREVDWVIEAVVEQREIKQPLLARVDEARGEDTIVSTNTSGLPIAA